MKNFSEFYNESENNFKVGEKVKINIANLGGSINVNELGGEDSGTIESVGGGSYDIKFSNGNVVKIKKEDVYSVGDSDTETP
jgi:hypothetical protein